MTEPMEDQRFWRRIRGGLTAGAVALAVPLPAVQAAGLSASELAGPGTGFRDLSANTGARTTATGAVGGILGSLDSAPRPPSDGGTIHLRPVPDGAARVPSGAPTGGLPATPRLDPSAPMVVPTPRLRPVAETLAPASAPSTPSPSALSSPAPVPPTRPSAAATSTTGQGPSPATPSSATPARSPTQAPASPTPVTAPDADSPAPTLIRADELRHERDLGIYSARGNVELTNGPRVVLADMVSYNERTDTLTANGNVRVVEDDGTTYFANYVELSSDFKDGFVRDMSVLLADRSRISAVYATRTAGERKDFWKGVYTACDTCSPSAGSVWPTLSGNETGTRERMPPVWQIRAAHVTHDEVARDIVYRDAVLEVFGLPVAYTPYLEQPDPTVYRRSGILSPTIGVDDQLGFWTEVPYYFVIDDHQDATLAARAMSDEGWLLRPEYRLRFAEGELSLDGSLTDDGDDGLSGHLDSRARWHINDVWRAGLDSELAAFDDYRDRYAFDDPDWLTNHAWVEAFSGRSYAAIEGFAYNDTRVGSNDERNPFVLPLMTYDYESEPIAFGGQTLLDASVQSIYREEGATSTRLSGSAGWYQPGTTGWGLAYEAEGRLNADLYTIDNANTVDGDPSTGFDGTVSRLYPSAHVALRYPMVRNGAEHQQIVEPVVSLSAAPPGLNTRHIPNEDSQVSELHQANLFPGDRTAGRDRIDDGVSVNYGMNWRYMDNDGGVINARFGQAYRIYDAETAFSGQAGYGTGLSDYVGGIDLRPNPYLDMFARVRLDRNDLNPNTALVGFRAGAPVLSISGTYVNATDLDTQEGEDLPRREEIVASVNTAFSRFWGAYAGGRYDVANARTVDIWGGLSYEDECLILAFDYTSSYNELDGEDEGESLMLRITLKTLGEISF